MTGRICPYCGEPEHPMDCRAAAERHHFSFWVQHKVDPSTAATMIVSQTVNQAIRRCKIGMVTRRELMK